MEGAADFLRQSMSYANIIINLKTRQLDKLFTYAIPPQFRGNISSGHRVVVPFGRGGYVDGVVWSTTEQSPDFKVRPIAQILPDRYALSQSQRIIMQLLRKYYMATYQEAYLAVLPSVQKLDKIVVYNVIRAFDDYSAGQVLSAEQLANFSARQLAEKVNCGELEKHLTFDFKHHKKTVEWVIKQYDDLPSALQKVAKRAVKKQRILKHMAYIDALPLSDLCKATRATRRDLVALVEAGFFKLEKRDWQYQAASWQPSKQSVAAPPLSAEQARVVRDYLAQSEPRAALLNGVTGSGKTRVYIELAKRAIQSGKQVLMLVPEISLTPQLVARFSSQLTSDIGVIHTYIRPTDKIAVYQRIKSGDIKIVIGARSAIFAPFDNLGLIVIDEEHEYSYKSETIPRYHTVELALALAKKMNIDILLGSATPAIKTHHLVDIGALKALYLKRSFSGSELSDIQIVDMTALPSGTTISGPLYDAIKGCFAKSEQVILFHNRKGFARMRQCHGCGYVHMCRNCAVPMTVYDNGRQFACHYCGYREPEIAECPICGEQMADIGIGIEQIEAELQRCFADRKFAVVDADTTRNQVRYRELLRDFESGKIDGLIGTQVLAKGLDFANVTLVGVLLADQLIHMPDYNSTERAYQLLTQVAGRAGRSALRGRALIQTYQPEHPLFDYVINRDFSGFIKEEKRLRDLVGYPPYVTLFTIKVQSEHKLKAFEQGQRIYEFYDKNFIKNQIDAKVYPPLEPYYGKIRQQYRLQIVFKVAKRCRAAVLKTLYYGIVKNKYNLIDPSCWVDVDFDG